MVEWQILMVGVVVLSAIGSILEKKTLFKEHAMEFSSVFAILMAGLSLILIPFLNFNFPSYFWTIIYVASILISVGFLFVAKSSRHLPISESSPLFAFGPVMTAILAWIVLKEGLTNLQITGIMLVFAGSYFLEMKPRSSFVKELLTPFQKIIRSKYIHYMLFAVLLYSISAVINRFALNTANSFSVDPITLLFILNMFVAFNSFIMIFVFHDGIKGIKHGIRSAGKWIGIMAILLLASRLLLVKSMSMPSAKIALIVALRRSSLIFSTFFGGEIFKDKHLKQRTLVSLIMVAGAILIVL